MANNDQIIGGIMAIIGAIGIILELFFLIITPLIDKDTIKPFDTAIYWAMAIPLFLGVAGVLAIVLWIGVTMIQTPPPEAWDFDDLEDELEGEDETNGGIEDIAGVTKTNAVTLKEAGFDTKAKLAAASVAELTALKGVGKATAAKIIENAK